jgi:protein arginine N-methyltransferase 7
MLDIHARHRQVSAAAAYGRIFQRVLALRLTHPQLYTCHSNRAAALLKLGLFDEALLDAERCRVLAHESFKKCAHINPYPP